MAATTPTRWTFINANDIVLRKSSDMYFVNGSPTFDYAPAAVASVSRTTGSAWITVTFADGTTTDVKGSWNARRVN